MVFLKNVSFLKQQKKSKEVADAGTETDRARAKVVNYEKEIDDLNKEWLASEAQLQKIFEIEQKEETDRSPEEKQTMERKAQHEQIKLDKHVKMTSMQEMKGMALAEEQTCRTLESTVRGEFQDLQKFCSTFIDASAIQADGDGSMSGEGSGQAQALVTPSTPTLQTTSPKRALQGLGNNEHKILQVQPVQCRDGTEMSVPCFELKNRAFRKIDVIQKELAEMMSFPACIEVGKKRILTYLRINYLF